jgi:predicted O-methyltransferase YrrM
MKKLKDSVFNLESFEDFKTLWNSPFSGDKGLNMFEAYSLYLFIRKYKPKKIKEMSPNNGFSTLVMSQAIVDEGYVDELEMFDSYDLNDCFCEEAREKSSKLKVFNFFVGDAKETLKLNEKIDFFFVDSDHSKSFAEWYVNSLHFADFIFVHDINPSEEYHLKYRGEHTENKYCGGEPLVVYNFLREKGYDYDYSHNKTFYPKNIVSKTEEGEYLAKWISVNNDDKNCEKIFWSLLNQINFFEEKPNMAESFIIHTADEATQLNHGFKVIGPSQSLFFQNF